MHGIKGTIGDRAYVEALEASAGDYSELRRDVGRASVYVNHALTLGLPEEYAEPLYEASAALTFVADCLEEEVS